MYTSSEYTILIFIIVVIIFSGIMISYNFQNNPPKYFLFSKLSSNSYDSYSINNIKPETINIEQKKFLSDYTNNNKKYNNNTNLQLY